MAALDGLLAEVGGLAAKLAAREAIARCLRDDCAELVERVERLLRQRGRRLGEEGEGTAEPATAEGQEPPPPEQPEERPEGLSKLLPPEFTAERLRVVQQRVEWQQRQRQLVDAAAAVQSEFVTQVAAPRDAAAAAPAGPRHAHARRVASTRAHEHLRKLLSALPEPAPEPQRADPAHANVSDDALVRLCILVRPPLPHQRASRGSSSSLTSSTVSSPFQTTYVQQLRPRLGAQLEDIPRVAPHIRAHGSNVGAFLAAAAAEVRTAAGDGPRGSEIGVTPRGGWAEADHGQLRSALRAMQAQDRWLPGGLDYDTQEPSTATGRAAVAGGSGSSAGGASLSYGRLDELEGLVRQRQELQLSQLALRLHEASWRAIAPALQQQQRPDGASGGRSTGSGIGEGEFLTLYRLLYGLACGSGRRGVTITRGQGASAAPAAAAAPSPDFVRGGGAAVDAPAALQQAGRRLTIAERHAAEYAAAADGSM